MSGALVQLPVKINRNLDVPIQDQLFIAIRDLIARGIIGPKMRLPASRALSQQLSVSRNTVKNAYANLISQGYLSSFGTSGTYVSERLPDRQFSALAERPAPESPPLPEAGPLPGPDPGPPPRAGQVDFALKGNNPAIAPERTWRRLLIKHLPFQARNAGQTDPAGLTALREAVAGSVCPLRGISVDPARCAIVLDDYRALDTVARVLTHRIRRVAVEDPCDSGLYYLLRSQGLEVVSVRVDAQGLCVEDLARHEVAAVFVTPSHQQPTGVTMSLARRGALLDWAAETGAHVVEWDTFGEFSYDHSPIPSLFSLDRLDRVVYVNGFSSWIGAGVQLCCVALPPGLIEQFLIIKPFLNPESDWLEQRAAAEFMASDSLFSHMRRVQQHFRQVRDTLRACLNEHFPDQRITGAQAGRHLVWHLPQGGPGAAALHARAREAGLCIPTLHDGYSSFAAGAGLCDPDATLLLGYARLDDESARAGVAALAGLW